MVFLSSKQFVKRGCGSIAKSFTFDLGVRRPGGALAGAGFAHLNIEKHSTIMGQIAQWGQSAARPAHSKELTFHLNQTFF
jgi:hypothetical protein